MIKRYCLRCSVISPHELLDDKAGSGSLSGWIRCLLCGWCKPV